MRRKAQSQRDKQMAKKGPSPKPSMKMKAKLPDSVTVTRNIQVTGKSISQKPNFSMKGNPYMDYLASLISPATTTCRIPDAYPRPTACFTTIQSFDVPIYNDNYSNGKFSFCAQPILGDTTTPSHYQLAVSNNEYFNSNSISWDDVNWSNANSYITTNGQGKDIRVDPNSGVMTTPPPTFYGTTFNVGTSTDLAPNVLLSNVVPQTNKFADSTTTFPLTSPGNPNPMFSVPNGVPAYSGGAVLLPFGDWAVTVSAKFQATAVPASGYAAINFLNYGPNAGQIYFAGIQQPQTVISTTGVTLTVAATMQVVSSPGSNILSFGICSDQVGTSSTSTSLISGTVSACTVTISPANFATSAAYLSGGIIEEIRPVSMATLVTYQGTTLNNGGEITINYLDNNLIANNFFQTNSGGIGQLQNINVLRTTPGNYDGPLKDGAYCIWAPYQNNDMSFYNPVSMNSHGYPGIVCTGFFSPDAAVASASSVLRVFLYVNYEYTTKYTCIETKTIFGSTAVLEEALLILKASQFACQNRQHLQKIRELLRKGWQFYKTNASVINPALASLAGLMI